MLHLSYAHLQLTANATADGGLTKLRAWASQTVYAMAPGGKMRETGYNWAVGRNQAFFADSETNELLVQPWIGMVASFGRIKRAEVRLKCTGNLGRDFGDRLEGLVGARCSEAQDRAWADLARLHRYNQKREARLQRLGRNRTRLTPWRRVGTELCGTHPGGRRLTLRTLSTGPTLHVVSNETASRQVRDVLDATSARLSPSVHLLKLHRWAPERSGHSRAGNTCSAFVGIGHLHAPGRWAAGEPQCAHARASTTPESLQVGVQLFALFLLAAPTATLPLAGHLSGV